MANSSTIPCPRCQQLQEHLHAQQQQIDALKATVDQLQRQLAAAGKNSATSSKPPSSDIVKPPKAKPSNDQATCSRGGQPGHPLHERPAFPPEMLNGGTHPHRLAYCPTFRHDLEPAEDAPQVQPQVRA